MLPIDDGDGFGMTRSQVGQAFTPTASPMDCASALSSTFGNMLRLQVDDIPLAHELDQKTHTSLQTAPFMLHGGRRTGSFHVAHLSHFG